MSTSIQPIGNVGYRVTICITFAWTVLLPFLWMSRLQADYDLTPFKALLAYHIEVIAVIPSAILLIAAWQLRRRAVEGLLIGTVIFPLASWIFAGGPSHASMTGALLFAFVGFRLMYLRSRKES